MNSQIMRSNSIILHDNHCTGSNDDVKQMELKLQKDPSLIHSMDASKNPLLLAAKANHKRCVQFLLSVGTDIEARDELGNTSLHLAMFNKNFELSQILIHHGINVNYSHDEQIIHDQANQNYLCMASRFTWYAMVELLLQYGGRTEDNFTYQRHYLSHGLMTPIAIATCDGEAKIITLLLLYGAKANTLHVNSKCKIYTLPILLLTFCEKFAGCKIEILNIFQLFGINISNLEPHKSRLGNLYQQYKNFISQPLSLQNLSRICIYRAIGKNYIVKVKSLETFLPLQIMDILKFSDI